jgi:hypothetical protein
VDAQGAAFRSKGETRHRHLPAGGLSQIDSFDYKPMLEQYDGKPLPYETPRTEFATAI